MQHKNVLSEADLDPNPVVQFARWYAEAKQRSPDPEAMTLATADDDGLVSSRIVLLKHLDERGFVFYTNYNSRKGAQLHTNPRASLCFYWSKLDRQVRVEGVVVKVAEEESDAYFATRPRGSQLSAWASDQSKIVVGGRPALEARFHELEAIYRDVVVPRPPHWGGYRLIPVMVEFWQAREDRLHDRICYRLRESKDWVIERLAP
jgi:pyridoxamine 5'-phosphate oxidase